MRCCLWLFVFVVSSVGSPGWSASPGRGKTPAAAPVTAPSASIDPSLLAGMKARSIGPAGMSGRVAALEATPSDPRIVYAGAATGGVWKSLNSGLTWTPVFDDQPVHAIGAIAVSATNPDTVWVGTGEGNLRNSASVGAGVFRSLDGGKSWTGLGLEATERIHRIVLHPTDPETAWVAALGREWGENSERGVYKTVDGGKSWRKVLYVDERTGAADVVIDPRNPNKLFAAMWTYRRWPYFFRSGGPGSGLYVSEDGGETWKKRQTEDGLPKGELGRIGVAICRSQPNIVYALVEAQKSALLRSDDGGKSFKTVNSDTNIVPRPFYFAELRADPVWPNRIYSLEYGVSVSDDGGKSFQGLPGADMLHGDYHAMWIDPKDGNRIYLSDDGGVGVSDDHGVTARHVGQLPLAQFYHVAVDDAVPYHVMGGLQDNGSWRGPSSRWGNGGIRADEWSMAGGGDGFDTQPVPGTADEVYSMSQGGYLSRMNVATGESRWIRPPEPENGPKLRFNWNAGLALDPFERDTVYYGSQFVHRSRDRGETWEILSPDLTTDTKEWQRQQESGGLTPDVSGAENHCTIIAIAPSPALRGVIWTGTDDGRLHVTRDGGKTWTSVEANVHGVPANTWIPHIKASPHDPATAFVVFDDHRRSNLATYIYKTTDYGQTFTALGNSGIRGYALAIEQDPLNEKLLFLGTEFGLYVSIDGGAQWMQFKHGLPTASVMDLVIHPREHDLIIATHGRALYVLDDIRPLRELTPALLNEPLHLFAPAPGIAWQALPSPGGFAVGHGEFRGENRPRGVIVTFSANAAELPLPDEKAERERKEQERQKQLLASFHWGPFPPASAATKPGAANANTAGTTPASSATASGVANPATAATKDTTDDKPPQAMVEIRDASGRLVRHFKTPIVKGLNRVVWDFARDDFKRLPPRGDEPEPEFPDGPAVIPGNYTLSISYNKAKQSTPVVVLRDPRQSRSDADLRAWNDAVEAIGTARATAAGLVHQLRTLKADVDAVMARRERDRKAKLSPQELAPEEPIKDPLTESWSALSTKLTERERRLWEPPDTKGIQDEKELMSYINQASYALDGQYAAPSPTVLADIEVVKRKTAAAAAEQKAFFDTEVKAFLDQLEQMALPLISR